VVERHSRVFVIGRYPPPSDGQTLATERVASFLDPKCAVTRLNTQAPEGAHVKTDGGFQWDRFTHYVRTRRHLVSALQADPEAPVVWNSISPTPIGHLRDVMLTLPAFQKGQAVHAVMHRGTFEQLFDRPILATTASRLVDRMTTFVFQSEPLAEACQPHIPEAKIRIIPNTIDDDLLITDEEISSKIENRKHRSSLRLLFLSNMMPEKGYDDVLSAVLNLLQRGLNVEIDFVGGWTDDASAREFDQAVDAAGVSDRVRHHGPIRDREQVRQMHLNADVFLLPTYHPTETQPKAIIEALNAATPVIATQRPQIAAMMTDGDEGFLVPPKSADAIAAAIERLVDLEFWTAASAAARARFETQFHPEIVGRKWVELVG
jgi:glycosyltransferase involved in cell wall biosynthesis